MHTLFSSVILSILQASLLHCCINLNCGDLCKVLIIFDIQKGVRIVKIVKIVKSDSSPQFIRQFTFSARSQSAGRLPGQARRISSKSMFMYLGELVEYGDTETLFSNPTDERTRAYLTGKMG